MNPNSKTYIESLKRGRGQILDDVKKIICNDRQDVHGNPEDTHARIAEYWSCYLRSYESCVIDLTAQDVALMMVLFKIARNEINPNHADNLLDAIGYAAIAAEIGDQYEVRKATEDWK